MFASKATTLILRIFLFFLLGPAFAIVAQVSGAIQSGSGTMNPLQGWSSDNIKQMQEASASMPQWFQSFGRALYGYDESPFLVASVMMRDPVLRTSALAGKGFLFDGLGGAVNGLWKMVSRPIQTAKGIGSAIANYDQTWGGIKKGLSDFGGRLASGDPTAYGQSGFEIASLFFPAAKASELSHLKYLSKGDEALKLAKAESLVAKSATTGAESALQGAQLNRHLSLLDEYGTAGSRALENGRIRYSGNVSPARTPGEMAGRRLVREWDPSSNATRTWHETVDHAGAVRIVRPETGGPKVHFQFDSNGNFIGSW